MKEIKDTEYIFISTRVKAMERGLLTRERMERMLDAPSDEAAAKVLVECGYPDLASVTSQSLEAALAQRQSETMADLDSAIPDRTVLDIFKVQFDYHNAKVLVKAQALGTQQDRLLIRGGRYDPDQLAADYRQGDLSGCSERFQQAGSRAC